MVIMEALAQADVAALFSQMREMETKYQAEIKELMEHHQTEMEEMEERHRLELEEAQEVANSSGRGRGGARCVVYWARAWDRNARGKGRVCVGGVAAQLTIVHVSEFIVLLQHRYFTLQRG